MYTGHNYGAGYHMNDSAPLSFYRISSNANDATEWGEEQTFRWPENDPVGLGRNYVTYSNLLFLANEGSGQGRLYNIARSAGQVWQIATSDDWGMSWTWSRVLSLPPAGGRAYSNGYVKFTSNGLDRIDFSITEAHPRDYNNGLYHGFIRDGKTHQVMAVLSNRSLWLQLHHRRNLRPFSNPNKRAKLHCIRHGRLNCLGPMKNQLVALFPYPPWHRGWPTSWISGYGK